MKKISVSGLKFVDSAGRQRIFNGINLCDKGGYEEGNDELAQARGTLGGLDPTRWVILDAQGNPSFAVIRNGSRNVSAWPGTCRLREQKSELRDGDL